MAPIGSKRRPVQQGQEQRTKAPKRIVSNILLAIRLVLVYVLSFNIYLFLTLEEQANIAGIVSSARSSALVASLAAFLHKEDADITNNIDTPHDNNTVSDTDADHEDDEIRSHVTFPFYLSCPGPESFPDGDYGISLLYTIDVVNNWEEVVRDQLHTLIKCGLWGQRATSFLVLVHSNSTSIGEGPLEQVREMISEYDDYTKGGAKAQVIDAAKPDNQEAVANFVTDTCNAQEEQSSRQEAFLFHFNTLGVSDYDPKWRIHAEKQEPLYTKKLYYRKFVEYFTLERPAGCLKGLLDGSSTCGVDMRQEAGNAMLQYGGKYWAASCKYVRFLDAPAIVKGTIRDDWIGSKAAGKKHINLVDSKMPSIDASMPMVYPEQYDANATRFHLACRKDVLPPGKYKIALVYHVGLLGSHWREVVADQLETLAVCGLGKRASEWIVTYSGGDVTELIDLLDTYRDRIAPSPQFVESLGSPWEGEAMNATRKMCLKREVDRDDQEPTYVFYFHSKGVSKQQKDREKWRHQLHRRSYGQIYYWRKFMEYYGIERPSLCVNKLINGASTCGAKFRHVKGTRHVGRYHYSGNFWAASCSFISTLPPCIETDYYAAEFWVGEGMPFERDSPLNTSLFVDLHLPKTESWRNSPSYTHLMLPEEYADVELIDDTYTSYL